MNEWDFTGVEFDNQLFVDGENKSKSFRIKILDDDTCLWEEQNDTLF